jgi:hypothetical protein
MLPRVNDKTRRSPTKQELDLLLSNLLEESLDVVIVREINF